LTVRGRARFRRDCFVHRAAGARRFFTVPFFCQSFFCHSLFRLSFLFSVITRIPLIILWSAETNENRRNTAIAPFLLFAVPILTARGRARPRRDCFVQRAAGAWRIFTVPFFCQSFFCHSLFRLSFLFSVITRIPLIILWSAETNENRRNTAIAPFLLFAVSILTARGRARSRRDCFVQRAAGAWRIFTTPFFCQSFFCLSLFRFFSLLRLSPKSSAVLMRATKTHIGAAVKPGSP